MSDVGLSEVNFVIHRLEIAIRTLGFCQFLYTVARIGQKYSYLLKIEPNIDHV